MKTKLMDLQVGHFIDWKHGGIGDIEIIDRLGSGAMGDVWLARDDESGKAYALKKIEIDPPDPVMAHRARMEAGVKLPSAYIVPIVDWLEFDGVLFLILSEYFKGRTLDRLIATGELAPGRKAAIYEKILRGVADAHWNNVIHRDLKPQNILVGDDDEVRIIDFGLAKFRDKVGVTVVGDMFGTTSYMPPEALVGTAYMADARTDIYALGHILYVLAMGHHFWDRLGVFDFRQFLAILAANPGLKEAIDLSDFKCDFFPGAGKVVSKMVQLDPTERYSSIGQVMGDLGIGALKPRAKEGVRLKYPILIIETGSNKGARAVVNVEAGGRLVLGRADVAGSDPSISREHLEFTRRGDDFYVRDLNSKNGTMLLGARLQPMGPPTSVNHGDRLKMGDVFLRFELLQEGSASGR